MDFGYVIKRNDNDFVVNIDLDEYGSGYNVVSKDIDSENEYDIEEVRVYCEDNPEMVIEDYPVNETLELEREKQRLQTWLTSHDYIGTKIATGRATVEEYADEIAEMKEKAQRINEINAILEG